MKDGWQKDNSKPHPDRCDRDTSLMPDDEIVRFLRLFFIDSPKGATAALANLIGMRGSSLRNIAKGKYNLGEESRGKLSYIVPLVRSGRLTFERYPEGMHNGKRMRTGMRPVMRAPKVEERTVLHYPAELMRTIRGNDDLPNLGLPAVRHRVHNLRGGTVLPQVQGRGGVGSGGRTRRYP